MQPLVLETPCHPYTDCHPFFQVLARTELPALRYRFNAPITRDSLPPYSWHYAPWTKCSAQCAGGEAGDGDSTRYLG